MEVTIDYGNGGNMMKNKGKIKKQRKKLGSGTSFIHKIPRINIHGIGFKLIMVVAIPIFFIICLGFISYKKASSALTKNYETAALKTIESSGEYLSLGIQGVETEVIKIITDDDFSVYYTGTSKNGKEEEDTYKALYKRYSKIVSSNQFVNSFNILSGYGESYASNGNLANKYQVYLESEEAKQFANGAKEIWSGYHNFLDQTVNVPADSYALSFTKPFIKGEGYIIIDVKMDKVKEVLQKISFGKGTTPVFITGDGREITIENPHEITFNQQSYYTEAVNGEKASGFDYVMVDGEKQLFLYSKIGKTGAMIGSLIPESIIVKQASDIRLITVILVVAATLIVIVIGSLFTLRIGKTIHTIQKGLSKVARGDLSATIKMKRKDEFQSLSDSVNDMTVNMRQLIKNSSEVGEEVMVSTSSVEEISSILLNNTKEINTAVDEIEKGVIMQAEESTNCLGQMSSLAERISDVYENTQEIVRFMGDTKSIVGQGTAMIDELMHKTKATSKITEVVIKDMQNLEQISNSIVEIVGAIDSIAEQTNLLSLNASIEAARAGEAGKGFSVVASEIRKLAEQSQTAASNINQIILNIQKKTRETVISTGEARQNVISQEETLKNTVEMFYKMNSYVESLSGNLAKIGDSIESIEKAKDDTLSAIENISAISEETASASEEVGQTLSNQLELVEKLGKASLVLGNNAKNLEESIKTFTI
jgi:methyl-accepting chemotaxis protein